MEYFNKSVSVLKRREQNALYRAAVPLNDAELQYQGDMSLHERLERLTTQVLAGYFVFPHHALVPKHAPHARAPFSFKRGPFLDLVAQQDFIGVQHALLSRPPPRFTKYNGQQFLAPLVGVRFSLAGSTRYTTTLTDMLDSQVAYQSLRATGSVLQRKEGYIRVGYAHGITVTAEGIAPERPSLITVQVRDVPSRSSLRAGRTAVKRYTSFFDLETLNATAPLGYFKARSGLQPWRTVNRVTYKVWPVADDAGFYPIIRESPEDSPRAALRREPLYFADLLGLRLVDGIARRQYGVRINQPLPRFPHRAVELARSLAERAIITDGRHGRKPSMTEREQLLCALAGIWQAPDAGV